MVQTGSPPREGPTWSSPPLHRSRLVLTAFLAWARMGSSDSAIAASTCVMCVREQYVVILHCKQEQLVSQRLPCGLAVQFGAGQSFSEKQHAHLCKCKRHARARADLSPSASGPTPGGRRSQPSTSTRLGIKQQAHNHPPSQQLQGVCLMKTRGPPTLVSSSSRKATNQRNRSPMLEQLSNTLAVCPRRIFTTPAWRRESVGRVWLGCWRLWWQRVKAGWLHAACWSAGCLYGWVRVRRMSLSCADKPPSCAAPAHPQRPCHC